MRHRTGYVAGLLVLLSVRATAQDGSAGDTGSIVDTRVRVTMASRERVTGTVVSTGADTLVLRLASSGSTRALPRSEIGRIERSAGTRRYRLRGGAIGFVAGLAAGSVVGYAITNERECTGSLCFNGLEESVNSAAGAAVGALVGTTLGVVIGGRERERWRPVGSDGGVRVGIGPAPGRRLVLTLALRR